MNNGLIRIGAIIMATCLMAHSTVSAAQTALARIEASIAEDSHIVQVSSDDVLGLLESLDAGNGKILLFDVREQDEFAVSHLPGAVRLAPDVSVEQFIQDYGARLNGVTPIFYCSVGRRSNALAEAVAAQSNRDLSPIIPTNLRGGIFRWHNEDKPLVNLKGATDQVHPYNWYWRRLLEHPEKSTYAPPDT